MRKLLTVVFVLGVSSATCAEDMFRTENIDRVVSALVESGAIPKQGDLVSRVSSPRSQKSGLWGLVVPDAITTELGLSRGRESFGETNPVVRAMPGALGRAAYFASSSILLGKAERALGKKSPLAAMLLRAYVAGLQSQMLRDNKQMQERQLVPIRRRIRR
jgi:hypothetical protein